jgi:hypothetical protein
LLALDLNDTDYALITKNVIKTADALIKLVSIKPKINDKSSPYKILTLQDEWKTLQKEFDLQEAVTSIGVQRIIKCVEEQYVEELNKDYFGYANQTIKTLLNHLCTKWCKVMTKERTDAMEAFYQAWVPSTTHVITFERQLTKQQKKCKTIHVIISEEAKTLHFVGQMYKSDYFTKEQMMKYEMQSNTDKVWTTTLQFFTNLYAQRKAYGNNRTANSGFDSAALVHEYPPNQSNCTIASTTSDITTRNLYIESLKESLAVAHEYVAKEQAPAAVTDPTATLRAELKAQRKQFDLIMKQNAKLLTAMAKNGVSGGGGGGSGGNGGKSGGHGGGGRNCSPTALCPNCNKMVTHKPEDCYSLEANKLKSPHWYKPCKTK